MSHTQTLIHHRDIQNWVSARHGMPAIARVPNSFGEMRARLALNFRPHEAVNNAMPELDDNLSPCSWSAWLAELDRQRLALKVSNQKNPDFEFVERQDIDNRDSGRPIN